MAQVDGRGAVEVAPGAELKRCEEEPPPAGVGLAVSCEGPPAPGCSILVYEEDQTPGHEISRYEMDVTPRVGPDDDFRVWGYTAGLTRLGDRLVLATYAGGFGTECPSWGGELVFIDPTTTDALSVVSAPSCIRHVGGLADGGRAPGRIRPVRLADRAPGRYGRAAARDRDPT